MRFSPVRFQNDNLIEEVFMTPAARHPREGLRDRSMLNGHVIFLIAYPFHIHILAEASAP
jgi:hypothetical protein